MMDKMVISLCVHSVAQSCRTLSDPTGLFAVLWIIGCQAPLSKEFSGKNTGVGCHFLLQGIFPTQGWNRMSPMSPALQAYSLPLSHDFQDPC